MNLFRGPFKVYLFMKKFILWAFKECVQAFLRVLEESVSHTAHLKCDLHSLGHLFVHDRPHSHSGAKIYLHIFKR